MLHVEDENGNHIIDENGNKITYSVSHIHTAIFSASNLKSAAVYFRKKSTS